MTTPTNLFLTFKRKAARTALFAGIAGIAATASIPAAAASLALTKSFEGNINFTGTQASLQSKAGGAKACDLLSSVEGSIALPANASVVSAILYWAGTGAVDSQVLLNGATVSAPAGRSYTSTIDGFTYFAAAADVTAQVQGKTSFSFGGLTVDTSDTYCSKKQKENSMVAGFALAVVYAHKDERYRTVNVYEGLQGIKNTSVTVPMPDYVPSVENTGAGRFGYIVWEGDKTGQQKGDYVSFAGEVLRSEPFIQKDNAFNSKSSAGSDENSGSIDFDIANLAGPPASLADAKAVFATSSDRVLLGTAIAALPSKPADLAITKTQAGEFKLGNEIAYTLSVTNQGARADAKVEIRDPLSGLLTYVSAVGADWTCAYADRTVTCKYGKPLLAGASASVVIKAKITTDGKVTNTGEVLGTADSVPGNDRSTVEGDTGKLPVNRDPYVFTTGQCKPGDTIKTTATLATDCVLYSGPVMAGSKPIIYVTRTMSGVATPASTTVKTSATLRFSLECNQPTATANVKASYAGLDLQTCMANGTTASGTNGTSATLEFPANEVSVPGEFHYPDVGRVTLRLRDIAGNVVKTTFNSLPSKIEAVYRRDDGVTNPCKGKVCTEVLTDEGFAEAGEPFVVAVTARGVGNIFLPNFGNETGEFSLAGKLKVTAHENESMLQLPSAWSGTQTVAGTLAWHEIGNARLSASLSGYLGDKTVLSTQPETIGRFYPAYFKTETEDGFGCLPRMGCPVEDKQVLSRAVFSRQKFGTKVIAWGRNGPVQRFQGALVPPITLAAVSRAGDINAAVLGGLTGGAAAANTERELSYKLPKGYHATINSADAGTSGWTAPTAVYLRATAPELRASATGPKAITVSSLPGVPGAEGGIMVVNGRLMVGNTIGTPLGKTPVPLIAQYWSSGNAWETNGLVEQIDPVTGTISFSKCRRSLRDKDDTGGMCDVNIVKVAGANAGTDQVVLPLLKGGKANLILAPVGERTGEVDVFVNGEAHLPSTLGRVTFGQFKSPVIYLREMY